MADITDLLPKKTVVPSPQSMPVRGVVSTPPVSLTELTMRVIVPSHSSDYDVECRWIRQGEALPTVGADCLVVWDETGAGTVVWWSATIIDVAPYVFTARVVGTWPTSTPGATTGTHIVLPRTAPVLIDVGATGYVTTGSTAIAIQVWIDGVNAGSMVLNPTIATVDRRSLGPCKLSPTLAAGDHYIALKQTSGTSDASDYADIAVLQP